MHKAYTGGALLDGEVSLGIVEYLSTFSPIHAIAHYTLDIYNCIININNIHHDGALHIYMSFVVCLSKFTHKHTDTHSNAPPRVRLGGAVGWSGRSLAIAIMQSASSDGYKSSNVNYF